MVRKTEASRFNVIKNRRKFQKEPQSKLDFVHTMSASGPGMVSEGSAVNFLTFSIAFQLRENHNYSQHVTKFQQPATVGKRSQHVLDNLSCQ